MPLAFLCPCADESTYPTWTVFTSSDLGSCGRPCTTRSSSVIWNTSRNSGKALLLNADPSELLTDRVLGKTTAPILTQSLVVLVVPLVPHSGTRRATSGRVRRAKATTTFSTATLPTRRSQSPRDCRSGTGRCWTMPLQRGFCTTTK